jgi:secreted trypsin-like serine protease
LLRKNNKKRLDFWVNRAHNTYMLKKQRKRRSDRNQAIYMLENTITGEQYIGLTVVSYRGNAQRTIQRRFLKHVQRAMTENKDWGLSRNIRKYGAESFIVMLVDVVRGKAEAHKVETALINELQPALNTFGVK